MSACLADKIRAVAQLDRADALGQLAEIAMRVERLEAVLDELVEIARIEAVMVANMGGSHERHG